MRANTVNATDTSINQLEEVFAAFNRVSAELGSSYRELEGRVTGLSEELTATHSARIQELTEKEMLASKLSALMDALPGGVIVLDAQGIIKEENPAAVQILDRSFQGRSWLKALEFSASIGPILDGEVSFHNGKRITMSSSAYGEEGDTIILLTDVSENYRLNNILNREQRLAALGEMAARLAHQVRTPLSSAILYLSHLSSNTITTKILDRLRQIEKLIEGMLSYLRGDNTANQEISLNELLYQVKDFSALQVEQANGRLRLDCPEQNCLIKGNQEALFNAISNLVENSIQAVASEPAVSLSLREEDGFYIISVEDNGPGVSEEIKEQIFDPFFSTRPMGNGLGLAVVLSVAKAHNGDVFVKSAKTGGTIIQLVIPVAMHRTNTDSGMWAESQRPFIEEPERFLIDPKQFLNNNLIGFQAQREC